MADHHFHNIVSKCNIPFTYYQPSKTSCFAGSASLISHPLVPTMTILLSFHCFSIQVQNSHASPFEFLLHRVHAPVAEHCWHHHYDHDEYKYCYCFCNSYKNSGNDNKNLNSHFKSAALILAFIPQFHKSGSVL